MDIWLDTANIQAIKKAVQCGLLSGVTTNPTIIASSKLDLESLLEGLLDNQEGPVTVQVMSDETEEMVRQGQTLFSFSNRLIVKVPVTKKGLEAIHRLSRQGIPTMATVLFTPQQAFMAAIAGADYIAPYISRLEKTGQDPWAMLASIIRIFNNYRFKTKILGASIKTVEQVMQCTELGLYGVTIKEDLLDQLMEDHALTTQSVQTFIEDYKHLNFPLLT